MRLYSFLKNNLNITKSEVMKLNTEGRILVSGKVQNLSRNIREGEIVTVDGVEIKNQEFVYYLYNKPKGVICTNNKDVKGNIINELKIDKRIYAVGRLDKDTRGLIILTNDNKLTHFVLESKMIEKEYIATVNEDLDSDMLKRMSETIEIDGKMTCQAKVKMIDKNTVSITILEGRYHQVRKLIMHAGCHLIDLQRIRIGNVSLDEEKIKEGSYQEVKNLNDIIRSLQ